MSWEQEVNDMWAAVTSNNSTNATETTSSQMWRWWSTVTHNVFLVSAKLLFWVYQGLLC